MDNVNISLYPDEFTLDDVPEYDLDWEDEDELTNALEDLFLDEDDGYDLEEF